MEIPRARPSLSAARILAVGLLILAASLAMLQRSVLGANSSNPLSGAMSDTSSRQSPTQPSPAPEQRVALAAEPTLEPAAEAESTPTPDASPTDTALAAEDSPLPTVEPGPAEPATPEPTATPDESQAEQPGPSAEQPATPEAPQTATPTSTATSAPQPTNTTAPRGSSPPTSTPLPASTPTWTPRPASTATWTPRPANTATFTPAATATPRPTATNTSTPKPTATKTPAPPPTATKAAGGTYNPTAESLALQLINSSRASAGLRALASSSAVQAVARAHAMDMATRNYFSHTTLGTTISACGRLTNAGIAWSWCAENLGMGSGFASPSDAIRTFHSSMMSEVYPNDGHKRNILSTRAGHIGIGVVQTPANKVYYVTDFIN